MLELLFLLVAAALGAWAHRHTTCDDRGLRFLLAAFGIGLVLQMALVRVAAFAPSAAAPLWISTSAAVGLGLWWVHMRLLAVGTRGRDLWVRVPLLILCALAAWRGSVRLALMLGFFAILAYRWRDGVASRHLAQLSIVALILGLAGIEVTSEAPRISELEGLTRAAAIFAVLTTKLALLYALFASLVLFATFARDPTLGIRKVSRRLALSHALVALVPITLLVVMWIFTTVLGVNQDRSKIGARAMAREARELRDDVRAIARRPDGRERLSMLADVRRATWPDMRLWWREGDRLQQVAGPPMAAAPLIDWHDSLAVYGDARFVSLGDSSFAGAVAAVPGDSTHGVIALLPTGPVLERVSTDLGVDLRLARRAQGSRERGNVRLVALADTFYAERSDSVWSLTRGFTVLRGISHGPRGWRPRQFILTSGSTTATILQGLGDLSVANPLSMLPVMLIVMLGLLLVGIGVWNLVMVTEMGGSITRAIAALRGGAERLRAGDLAHRIDVQGQDELWDVAGVFNHAADGLEQARELEKERDRIENELAVAQRIQSRLLPVDVPRLQGLEIAGHYDPAREIGGDYYDHRVIDEGRVLLVIADVSGKSVPAALIMSAFRSALVSQDLNRIPLPELASRLNEFLHHSLDPGKFVTAFLAVLEAGTGRMTYVNAGHNPPFLMRCDGRHETLDEGGTILGILAGSSYVQGEAVLNTGDLVALYTDGVSEGANGSGEQWGDDRLLDALRAGMKLSARELTDDIARQVRAFEGDAGPTDDITLLIARR